MKTAYSLQPTMVHRGSHIRLCGIVPDNLSEVFGHLRVRTRVCVQRLKKPMSVSDYTSDKNSKTNSYPKFGLRTRVRIRSSLINAISFAVPSYGPWVTVRNLRVRPFLMFPILTYIHCAYFSVHVSSAKVIRRVHLKIIHPQGRSWTSCFQNLFLLK